MLAWVPCNAIEYINHFFFPGKELAGHIEKSPKQWIIYQAPFFQSLEEVVPSAWDALPISSRSIPPHLSGAEAHFLKAAFLRLQSRSDSPFIASSRTSILGASCGAEEGLTISYVNFYSIPLCSLRNSHPALCMVSLLPSLLCRFLRTSSHPSQGGGRRVLSALCLKSALLFSAPPSPPRSEVAGAFPS